MVIRQLIVMVILNGSKKIQTVGKVVQANDHRQDGDHDLEKLQGIHGNGLGQKCMQSEHSHRVTHCE